MNPKERREAHAAYGKQILDDTLAIAGAVGDKLYDYLKAHEVDGFTVQGAARFAQRVAMEELEFRAYESGLASDPRD